jgi:hypothetical protein
LTPANVVLRGGGVDESPHCYKRLDELLAAHGETIRVLHTLTPLGVAIAGANEFDCLRIEDVEGDLCASRPSYEDMAKLRRAK